MIDPNINTGTSEFGSLDERKDIERKRQKKFGKLVTKTL